MKITVPSALEIGTRILLINYDKNTAISKGKFSACNTNVWRYGPNLARHMPPHLRHMPSMVDGNSFFHGYEDFSCPSWQEELHGVVDRGVGCKVWVPWFDPSTIYFFAGSVTGKCRQNRRQVPASDGKCRRAGGKCQAAVRVMPSDIDGMWLIHVRETSCLLS